MKNIIASTVFDNNCIGCGICGNVCEFDAIKIIYNEEKEYVPVVDEKKCTECGQCIKYCPNRNRDSVGLKEQFESKDKIAYGIDNACGYFYTKAYDEALLRKTASGGFSTSLAISLLEKGEIDCVLHGRRRLSKTGEEHYEAVMSTTKEEIEASASSIYGPLSFKDILKDFKGKSQRILIIGTPCVISGMKKLFSEHKDYKDNFIYTIALCCSHNVNGQFVDFIADIYGVEGEYTANLRAKPDCMKDHSDFHLNYKDKAQEDVLLAKKWDIFNPIWRNFLFAQEACTNCCDFWGKDADASVKDAWGSLGSEDKFGSNIVIFRNPQLMSHFEQMHSMEIKKIDFDTVRGCQIATVREKQIDNLNRICKVSEGSEDYKNHMFYMQKSKQMYRTEGADILKKELADVVIAKENSQEAVKQIPKKKSLKRTILNLIKRVIKRILRNKLMHYIIFTPIKRVKGLVKYKKKRYNKVLMVATFNKINAGDEAQIDATIKILQDRYPDHLIKCLSHVPLYTHKEHYNVVVAPNPREALWDLDVNPVGYVDMDSRFYRWMFLIKGYWAVFNSYLVRADMPTFFLSAKRASLLQDIKTSDLVYFSGGGGMTGATLSRCWDFMFTMKIAKIMKVPCVMSGQNSGLWGSEYTKNLVSKTLKHASAITLRDPYAVDNLKEIGIYGDHVFTMFDDALFCDKLDDVSLYLNEFDINDDKYIAMNIHYWGIENSKEEQKDLLKRLGEFCDYMYEKTGYKILLIPMATVDREPMEDFIRYYGKEHLKVARFLEYDFRILRGLFSKAQFCVTMKHHPIIFAVGEKIPTLSMAYKPYYLYKNKGALDIFKLSKYSFDIEQSTYMDEFRSLFGDMVDNREKIVSDISDMLEDVALRRERLFKIVDEILK